MEVRFIELDDFFNRVKTRISANDNILNFDDYKEACSKAFPKKTQRWIEISYNQVVDGFLSDKTPHNIAFLNIV